MGIGSLKDLYLDELADLYDAENQMILALPGLADSARAPELKEALQRHGEQSRLHLERLQLIFTHWGEKVASRRCAGIAGIVQEADDRVTEDATDDARDAAIIGVAQRIEHYEIAAYGCARTYARRLNRADEARLLQETLDEEGRADHRLSEIAEAHINDDARSEADFLEQPSRRRLRYVDARQLDYRRTSADSLEVWNDADAKLGVFDGLVVDAESAAPRYAVVDARGVFTGRRYLLPLARVRFDARIRVLRVDLEKDVAAKYPEFDRDEFEKMDDETLRHYEGRLLDVFSRADRTRRSAAIAAAEQQAWLATGVWMTMPVPEPDRLSDEAPDSQRSSAPPERERMVAQGERDTPEPSTRSDAPTPPHGDKMK